MKSTVKRALSMIGTVVAIAAGTTAAGHATTFVSAGGSTCQVATTGSLNRSISGVVNASTSAAVNVVCPLNLGTTTDNQSIGSVFVGYYDGSKTSGFACQVQQTLSDGVTVYNSISKYTAQTAGGDSNPTTVYNGNGYISFNSTELGANLTTHRIDSNYIIFCTVAPSTVGSSGIISYYASF